MSDKLQRVKDEIAAILEDNGVVVWVSYGDLGYNFILRDEITGEELYTEELTEGAE